MSTMQELANGLGRHFSGTPSDRSTVTCSCGWESYRGKPYRPWDAWLLHVAQSQDKVLAQMRDEAIEAVRDEFVRLLTVDGPTRDRRRRDYNQAIFLPDGQAMWSSTTLGMVMSKFDRAVKRIRRGP